MAKKNKSADRLKQPLILILAIFIAVSPYFWFQGFSFKSLTKLGYLGIFFINFITSASVIIPIPGAATAFLGGAILNPIIVGIAAGLGAGLGESFGYLAGYEGRGLLKKYERKNSWLTRLKKLFMLNGFLTILVCAAIPFPFFDFIGILAGLLKYPLPKFLLAVILGRVARDIIFAWTGAKFLPY